MPKTVRLSIGKEAAIMMAESKWWENREAREVVEFQLFTEELCMDFSKFHELLEKVLERPVFTHELGPGYDGIVSEFLGEKEPPTMDEIMNLIPEEKRLIVNIDDQDN